MLTVALTGGSGLVGSRVIELLKNDFSFISLSQEQMDITDQNMVDETISNLDFDLFLHLAAYTNVDGAEKQKDIAYKINVQGTKNLFNSVLRKQKKFIYVSTDFVFDGSHPPYDETTLPQPISCYGQTKYEAEQIIKDKAMIVRICFPYRARCSERSDFVRKIQSLLEQKKQITMVTDSTVTPTFIDDIAYALKYLFNNFSPEIYHLVGSQSLSSFEAGKLIAQVFHLDENLILPITYDEYYKGKAKRPQYSLMISQKNNFYKMKSFREGLKELYSQLSH